MAAASSTSGRFHRATAEHPAGISWPALYAAVDLAVALGEIQRNVRPERIDTYRFTELWAQFEAVLDIREPVPLGLSLDRLLDDGDYSLSQALAAAARDLDAEGLLVPSTTRLGDNLIVFPERLSAGSVLVEVRSIDPKLIKTPR